MLTCLTTTVHSNENRWPLGFAGNSVSKERTASLPPLMDREPGNTRRTTSDAGKPSPTLKQRLRNHIRVNYSEIDTRPGTMDANLGEAHTRKPATEGLPSGLTDFDLFSNTATNRSNHASDSDAAHQSFRAALRAALQVPGATTGEHRPPEGAAEDPPRSNSSSVDDVLSAVYAAMTDFMREQQSRREVALLKKIQTQVSEQLATERRVADATVVGRLVGLALADTNIVGELRSLKETIKEQQAQIQSLEAKLQMSLEKGTRRDSRSPVPRGTRDRRKATDGRDNCEGLHCTKCDQRAMPTSNASDDSARRVNQWLMDHYKRQAALPPRGEPPAETDWKDAAIHEEVATGNPPSSFGPRQAGLIEIQPSEPTFQKALSYRRYRLIRTNPDISDAVLARTGDLYKKLKHVLGSNKFDGRDPITIIPFLSAYKKQCDRNNVTEGAALVLLPNFLKGEAKESFEANFELGEDGTGGFQTYPGAVQHLLRMYATDGIIERVVEEIDNLRQREDETERQFATRLRQKARSCGPVYSEADLITRFLRGLSPDLKPLLRAQRHDFRGPRAFYDFVERATAAGDANRALIARYAKRPKDAAKSNKVFAVQPTSASASSRRSRRQSSNGRKTQTEDAILLTERYTDRESDTTTDSDTVTEFESSGFGPDEPADAIATIGSKKLTRKRQSPPDGIEICYLCFEEGHRSPNCRFNGCRDDPGFQRYSLCNYARLKPKQREFIDSVGQMPQMLLNHEPLLNIGKLKVDADHANASASRARQPHSPKTSKAHSEGKTLSFQTAVESTKN